MNENNNSNNTEPILPQGDASNTPIMTPETSIPTPVIDTKNTPSAAQRKPRAAHGHPPA